MSVEEDSLSRRRIGGQQRLTDGLLSVAVGPQLRFQIMDAAERHGVAAGMVARLAIETGLPGALVRLEMELPVTSAEVRRRLEEAKADLEQIQREIGLARTPAAWKRLTCKIPELGVKLDSKIKDVMAEMERKVDSSGDHDRASRVTWTDDIEAGLRNLGGEAHLSDIYRTVKKIRKEAGRSTPGSSDAIIRRCLEFHSRDSDVFNGVERFVMLEKGTGRYRLARTSRL